MSNIQCKERKYFLGEIFEVERGEMITKELILRRSPEEGQLHIRRSIESERLF